MILGQYSSAVVCSEELISQGSVVVSAEPTSGMIVPQSWHYSSSCSRGVGSSFMLGSQTVPTAPGSVGELKLPLAMEFEKVSVVPEVRESLEVTLAAGVGEDLHHLE